MVEELEKVLTIDGRGRPKKAVLLLELIAKYGVEAVLAEIKKIGEIKCF